MEEIKNSENHGELPRKNIEFDLLHFKNDILKDIRSIKLDMNEKYSILEEKLKEKINQFDLTIKSFQQKIFELSNLIVLDKSIKEKVENLNAFKEEANDTIFKQRAKFNEFENRMGTEIDRINKILIDSVIYPGIIGGNSKFKTFHEYIDFTLKEINDISLVKDKNGMDFKPYKKKIEQTIDAFRLQINNIYTKEMTNNIINQSIEKIQNSLKSYNEKIRNIKVENYGNNLNISNKIEELNNKLNSLNTSKKYFEYDSDILYIKKEINRINEILREFFTVPEVKKEIESKNKIYSGVKQYIDGLLNAKQLTSMKKFSYEKSNSGKIKDRNNNKNISPFPSAEKFLNKNSFDKKKYHHNHSNSDFNIEYNDNNNKENVFISQKNYVIDSYNSHEIRENKNDEKLVNRKIEFNELDNSSEKNETFNKINFDNRNKKIYKEEELFLNKFNISENSKNNEDNQINKNINNKINHEIISEEDENILSDNANIIKERLNKVKKLNLFIDNTNNKNTSVELTKNFYKETNLDNNENSQRILNITRQNNNLYNKNRSNLFQKKAIKEKEYNQSVPIFDNKNINNIREIKTNNKEDKGTQFNGNKNHKNFRNKTYTSFPHIKEEMKEKNNSINDKNQNLHLKINNNSIILNEENNNPYLKKKEKKILLINPNLVSTYNAMKNNKSANKIRNANNTGIGFKNKKNFDKIADEMIKGFVNKKKNKLLINGVGNYQTYNSLYEIITTHENSIKSKKIKKGSKTNY